MSLLRLQLTFARNCTLLLDYLYEQGYEYKFGEAQRSDEQAEINALGKQGREAVAQLIERAFPVLARKIRNNVGSGIRGSLHESQLAVDLHLFFNGVYLEESEAYEKAGVYWESLHPLNRWGGKFKPSDGNHFSMEFQGRK